MSTRAQLDIIKDNQVICKLYHHYDGYIDGVGFALMSALEKERRQWCKGKVSCASFLTMLIKDPSDEWELALGTHTDIEYLYKITVDNNDYIKTIEAEAGGFYIDNQWTKERHWDEDKIKRMMLDSVTSP